MRENYEDEGQSEDGNCGKLNLKGGPRRNPRLVTVLVGWFSYLRLDGKARRIAEHNIII